MSEKRFYIPLVIILCLSVLLFGVSYSKESGKINYTKAAVNKDGLKIVYDNGNFINVHNSTNPNKYQKITGNIVSITNESKKNKEYLIKIKCDNCFNKEIYYSLDKKAPQILNSEIIYQGTLSKYGTEDDHVSHELKFFTPKTYNEDIKYEIISNNENTKKTSSGDVYES